MFFGVIGQKISYQGANICCSCLKVVEKISTRFPSRCPWHRGNKRTHLALISLSASGHCLLLLPRASLTLAKAAVHFNSTVCLSSDIQFIYCDQLLFFIAIITVEIVNTISFARVLDCKRGRSILMITVIIPVKVRSHACNGIQMFPPAPMKTLVLI